MTNIIDSLNLSGSLFFTKNSTILTENLILDKN